MENRDRDRDRLLAGVFARLADTLVDDFDVVEFLYGLCTDAVKVIDAETAGVMLADTRGKLRLIASSEERMRTVELFELQDQQGPCLDAYRTGETVTATSAEGLERWPRFAREASSSGFCFMCAIPMRLRGTVIGALNLFRGTDERFAESDLEVARAMSQIATTGLLQRRAVSEGAVISAQLQYALQSRVSIEQAKGVLAEYLGVTVEEAFDRLRRRARDTNRKLTALAQDVATKRLSPTEFARSRSRR